MRIGIAIHSLEGGGAEFVARRWIDYLCAQGHRVYLYTFSPVADQRDVPADCRRRRLRPRGPRAVRVLRLAGWLRRRCSEDQPDVLLTMLTPMNVIAVLALLGTDTPVVVSERNFLSAYFALEGRSGRIQLRLAELTYRRAAGAVAISHPIAAELVARFRLPSDRVFVVPNPVITADPPAAELPGRLAVGFVGRIAAQKQPRTFVDTLVVLRERGTEVTGVILGDGPEREEMARYATVRGVELTFLGWREPWWHDVAFDCLLLPSRVEGFGNVLVEAAAAGIPVVASSRSVGVADAIVPGMTGELALTDDPEDFADAIGLAVRTRSDPRAAWLQRFSNGTSGALLHRACAEVSRRAAQHAA